MIRKKENRPEAADYGRSNLRNQRRIDFLRSTARTTTRFDLTARSATSHRLSSLVVESPRGQNFGKESDSAVYQKMGAGHDDRGKGRSVAFSLILVGIFS